jgi:hypothetical protein
MLVRTRLYVFLGILWQNGLEGDVFTIPTVGTSDGFDSLVAYLYCFIISYLFEDLFKLASMRYQLGYSTREIPMKAGSANVPLFYTYFSSSLHNLLYYYYFSMKWWLFAEMM